MEQYIVISTSRIEAKNQQDAEAKVKSMRRKVVAIVNVEDLPRLVSLGQTDLDLYDVTPMSPKRKKRSFIAQYYGF